MTGYKPYSGLTRGAFSDKGISGLVNGSLGLECHCRFSTCLVKVRLSVVLHAIPYEHYW